MCLVFESCLLVQEDCIELDVVNRNSLDVINFKSFIHRTSEVDCMTLDAGAQQFQKTIHPGLVLIMKMSPASLTNSIIKILHIFSFHRYCDYEFRGTS